MKILGLVAGAAMLVMGAQGASAVSIVNGSFENGTIDPGSATHLTAGDNTSITGWTVGGAGGVDYIGTYWQAGNGDRSLDLSGTGIGSISQILTGLTIGQEYTISYMLSGNPAGDPVEKNMIVAIDSLGKTIGGRFATYNTGSGNTLGSMNWITQTVLFTANATTATLSFLSQDNTPYGAALDNVTIAATPIPGAILLFGSALGGMGFLGFRRKKLEAAA